MGSPFLAMASGLSQGLPSGLQIGSNIMAQRQQNAIQQQQADAASLDAVSKVIRLPDPAMRKLGLQKTLPDLGIDINAPDGKNLITALTSAQDNTINDIASQIDKIGMHMTPQQIGDIYNKDPAFFANLLWQATKQKNMAAILTGTTNPDGTPNMSMDANPSTPGSVSPGTGGAGGGGAVAAGGAGTSTSGSTTLPPASTTPEQAVTDQNRQPSQAGTPPKLGIGADGNPLTWAASSDPYVIAMNKRILLAQGLPSDDAAQATKVLMDQRDLYIEGKYKQYTHMMDIKNYQVSLGHLSIDQRNSDLQAARLHYDMTKPKSPLGEIISDANNGLLTLNGGKNINGVSTTIPVAGGQGDRTPIDIPKSLQKKDLSTVAGPANADGTFDIKDEGTLKALGLGDKDRLVYDPATGGMYIQHPGPASLQTPAAQDDAQSTLNATTYGRNQVKMLMTMLEKDPRQFAIAGSIKGFLQNQAAKAEDIAAIVPGMQKLVGQLDLPKNYFNPNLPTIEMSHRILTVLVAQALTFSKGGTGAGGFPALMKVADEMTDFTGNKSSKQIYANLQNIDQLLAANQESAKSGLPVGGTSGVSAETGSVPAATVPAPVKTNPNTSSRDVKDMEPEQIAELKGTINDPTPSNFSVDTKTGTSHLSKIPNGDLLKLKMNMEKYKGDETSRMYLRNYFDSLYGTGKAKEAGY